MKPVHLQATRHAPFGMGRAGSLVHRCVGVRVYWGDNHVWGPRNRPSFAARWSCGSTSTRPVLLNEAPDGAELCPRCYRDSSLPVPADRMVYFAERDGLIKIGTSCDPTMRCRGMRADLLAVEPGGFLCEKARHAQFAADRVVGEWFQPVQSLLAHIASLTPEAS